MVFNMPIEGPLECFYKYAIFINIEIRKKKLYWCIAVTILHDEYLIITFKC